VGSVEQLASCPDRYTYAAQMAYMSLRLICDLIARWRSSRRSAQKCQHLLKGLIPIVVP
jgi:hypothetical protein